MNNLLIEGKVHTQRIRSKDSYTSEFSHNPYYGFDRYYDSHLIEISVEGVTVNALLLEDKHLAEAEIIKNHELIKLYNKMNREIPEELKAYV